MKHSNTPFRLTTLALSAALALGACASTAEKPTMTETETTTQDAVVESGVSSTIPSTLVLNVSGYKKQSGQIMVAVYNSVAAFDSEGAPFRDAKVAVTAAQTSITFDDLTVGDYAFKVFHDENGNGKLDTNAFGMPTEKYGFSMDASDPFSAPEWGESKFSLSSGENLRNVSLD